MNTNIYHGKITELIEVNGGCIYLYNCIFESTEGCLYSKNMQKIELCDSKFHSSRLSHCIECINAHFVFGINLCFSQCTQNSTEVNHGFGTALRILAECINFELFSQICCTSIMDTVSSRYISYLNSENVSLNACNSSKNTAYRGPGTLVESVFDLIWSRCIYDSCSCASIVSSCERFQKDQTTRENIYVENFILGDVNKFDSVVYGYSNIEIKVTYKECIFYNNYNATNILYNHENFKTYAYGCLSTSSFGVVEISDQENKIIEKFSIVNFKFDINCLVKMKTLAAVFECHNLQILLPLCFSLNF